MNDEQAPIEQSSEINLLGRRHKELPEIRIRILEKKLRRSVRLKWGSKEESGGDGTTRKLEAYEAKPFRV